MDGPPSPARRSGSPVGVRLDLLVAAGAAVAASPDRFRPGRRHIGIRVRAPEHKTVPLAGLGAEAARARLVEAAW